MKVRAQMGRPRQTERSRPRRSMPSSGVGNATHARMTELQRAAGNRGVAQLIEGGDPQLQRQLEVRPVRNKKTSAFGRRQELIDRLNTVSPAIQYKLNGRRIEYTVVDAKKLKHFDKMMQTFVDNGQLVPMILINQKGYVQGSTKMQPLFGDSFVMGYVDLDDMMSNDLLSFQSDLLHFLTERFGVKNYAKKLGGDMGNFERQHRKGKSAEAAQLKALLRDPSIVFLGEWRKGSTWVNAFKSRTKGYRIYQIARRTSGENVGGKMYFKPKNGKMVLLSDHLKSLAKSP